MVLSSAFCGLFFIVTISAEYVLQFGRYVFLSFQVEALLCLN